MAFCQFSMSISLFASEAAAIATKPHIIHILADDMGWSEVGALGTVSGARPHWVLWTPRKQATFFLGMSLLVKLVVLYMTERHRIYWDSHVGAFILGSNMKEVGFRQKGSNWEASYHPSSWSPWAYHDFNRVVPSLPLVFEVQEIL